MKIIIRKPEISEFYQTENVTREAFWNLYKPGCDEHLVLHQLRKSSSYISELDLIALFNNEITGHIISTIAKVIDNQGNETEVLCVGPVSVLPAIQNKGIGTKLIKFSISEAKKMGFKGMILFGNPEYYHRFGFVNAKEYDITTKDYQNFDPFMALELSENGLGNAEGRFVEDDAFTTREEELLKFEMQFPLKEKGEPRVDISHP